MKPIPFKIEYESFEEQTKAGRYNPNLIVVLNINNEEIKYSVSSGRSDSIYVFKEEKYIYVLSVNKNLGYVGLEIFEENEQIDSIFIDKDYEIKEILGKSELDLTPINIVKRLESYA